MPKTKKPTYTLTLSIGSDKYNFKGEAIIDCLEQLPKKVKGDSYKKSLSFFRIEHGASLADHKVFPTKMQRLLNKSVDRQLFAKKLNTIL